jgi:hypothetical protein
MEATRHRFNGRMQLSMRVQAVMANIGSIGARTDHDVVPDLPDPFPRPAD